MCGANRYLKDDSTFKQVDRLITTVLLICFLPVTVSHTFSSHSVFPFSSLVLVLPPSPSSFNVSLCFCYPSPFLCPVSSLPPPLYTHTHPSTIFFTFTTFISSSSSILFSSLLHLSIPFLPKPTLVLYFIFTSLIFSLSSFPSVFFSYLSFLYIIHFLLLLPSFLLSLTLFP